MLNRAKSKIVAKRNLIGELESTNSIQVAASSASATSIKANFRADYVTLSNFDLNGTETIDGSSPSDGDTLLVANQSTASENGLYEYSTSGDWTRITGLVGGSLIVVKSGSTKADTLWIVKSDSFTEGTDNITIEEHSINRNDGSINGLSAITLTSSDVFLGEDASNSYSKGKFTLDDVKTYLENEYDSSYLLRSAGDFDSFTGLGTIAPTDVILVEDADDSFNKKKTTAGDIAALSNAGYWDTIFELGTGVDRTNPQPQLTMTGSTNTLATGTYEIEVTLIGYADSGSPQGYPTFGLPFTGTIDGTLPGILDLRDTSSTLYSIGDPFYTITNLTEDYYQFKGIFRVTASGDLSMTLDLSAVPPVNTVYASAGTGYKLRKIV